MNFVMKYDRVGIQKKYHFVHGEERREGGKDKKKKKKEKYSSSEKIRNQWIFVATIS